MSDFEISFVRNHVVCTKDFSSKDGLTTQSQIRVWFNNKRTGEHH